MEIGKTFMYLGEEYVITYIKDQKLNIEPMNEKFNFSNVSKKIQIENTLYKVVFVNPGKKRISLIPVTQ